MKDTQSLPSVYGIIRGMSFSSGDFFDAAAGFAACCGCARPMTPEEEVREKERQRREAEWINRHPFRFLLKFLLALAFLIFSWWNVHRLWVKDMAMPPSYRVP